MRASSTAAIVFIATLFVVGCTQSPSPTVPSSASSVASSALGPGASYNATGTWRIVDSDVHGNDAEVSFTDITQDGEGNLHFLDEGAPITAERLGTGVIITYRLSFIGNEGGDCDLQIQGTMRLDTRTNTMTMNVLVRQLGCEHQHLNRVLTGTKVS